MPYINDQPAKGTKSFQTQLPPDVVDQVIVPLFVHGGEKELVELMWLVIGKGLSLPDPITAHHDGEGEWMDGGAVLMLKGTVEHWNYEAGVTAAGLVRVVAWPSTPN